MPAGPLSLTLSAAQDSPLAQERSGGVEDCDPVVVLVGYVETLSWLSNAMATGRHELTVAQTREPLPKLPQVLLVEVADAYSDQLALAQ